MLSFANECKVLVCKSGVAAGTTAISDATIVDMQGYDTVAFVAVLGADAAERRPEPCGRREAPEPPHPAAPFAPPVFPGVPRLDSLGQPTITDGNSPPHLLPKGVFA